MQGDDSIEARTKDGQQVYIDASVIYAIDPKQLINLHISWQDRYQDNVVGRWCGQPSGTRSRNMGSKRSSAPSVPSLRKLISDTIQKGLDDNNLVMSDFLLRNIRFSDQYAQAVEQKQIAEQQALQAKLVVEQKKQEAEQARQVAQGTADAAVISAKGAADARVIQAQAEAKANTVLTQSLTPELLQYQYIIKLAPGVQTIFMPSGNQFILPLPNTAVGQ